MPAQVQPESDCPRCGQRLAEFAEVCHRCGLRLAPGVAFFPSDDTTTDTPSPDIAAAAYERRQVRCLPMDLERIARAESVDGWSLLDTTVDPDVAGNIVAHFRRPVRSRPAAAGAGTAGTSQPPARAAAAGRAPQKAPVPQQRSAAPAPFRPAARQPARPTPAAQPRQAGSRDPREILYVVLLVVAFIFLVQHLEFLGLLIGIFLLPSLLRNVLGISRKNRRRRDG